MRTDEWKDFGKHLLRGGSRRPQSRHQSLPGGPEAILRRRDAHVQVQLLAAGALHPLPEDLVAHHGLVEPFVALVRFGDFDQAGPREVVVRDGVPTLRQAGAPALLRRQRSGSFYLARRCAE